MPTCASKGDMLETRDFTVVWVTTASRSFAASLSSNMTWLKGSKVDQLHNLVVT